MTRPVTACAVCGVEVDPDIAHIRHVPHEWGGWGRDCDCPEVCADCCTDPLCRKDDPVTDDSRPPSPSSTSDNAAKVDNSDVRMCWRGHPFEWGIAEDYPEGYSSPDWCNVCGESQDTPQEDIDAVTDPTRPPHSSELGQLIDDGPQPLTDDELAGRKA